jgi:(p)ppGpp synthase/HD superfamily hydrolase
VVRKTASACYRGRMAPTKSTPPLSKRFEEALAFANQLHQSQRRKGTQIPYMSHLMGVSSIALENGADEDEAIAALLHDSVEDQGGHPTLLKVRERFGERVAEIVEGCTDAETTPKPPWKERKEKYIAHLGSAKPGVLLVSAADKLHNARSLISDFHEVGDALWDRFKGGRDGTLWYYRALVNAFRKVATPKKLLDDLDRVVTELETIAR